MLLNKSTKIKTLTVSLVVSILLPFGFGSPEAEDKPVTVFARY